FPGGSITGAPKIRAMEIIHDLENRRRGPYCGAIGWIGDDGAMDTSIAIRTVIVDGETLSVSAGGGIVADSDPTEEYRETLVKAAPLLRAVTPNPSLLAAEGL
ncbi:MAG: chorismate-binding protein, partial [Rhodospirillaceae bacterium]|nr:chorismate-binding protein [Rhodospirillaceae bacterium]